MPFDAEYAYLTLAEYLIPTLQPYRNVVSLIDRPRRWVVRRQEPHHRHQAMSRRIVTLPMLVLLDRSIHDLEVMERRILP